VFAGTGVAEGQGLWTCPWGGADVRYADGTSVSLDRSTTARFAEVDKGKRVMVKSGVVSLMRWPAKPRSESFSVETPLGSVALENGQVVVVVSKDRLLVEVGMGQAEVRTGPEARPVTVTDHHYAVVQSDGQVEVATGRLAPRLEPLAEGAAKKVL